MTSDAAPADTAEPLRRRRGRPRHEQPSAEYLAKRAEIVDVAVEVFRVRGYDAATLEDVASALDFRRASLYHYVPSKAHLLYLILDRAVTTALSRLDELDHIDDPGERLVHFVRHQTRAIAAETGMFKVFFDDRSALDARYEQEIVEKERRYLKAVTAMVAEAGEAGAITPVDPHYGAHVLLGMTTWVYKWFDPDRDDPEVIVDTCLGFLLRPRRRR